MSLGSLHTSDTDGSSSSSSGSSSSSIVHRGIRTAPTPPSGGAERKAVELAKETPQHAHTQAKYTPDAGAITGKRGRVAFAITVTRDGHFVDGALVLGFAARKYHSALKGYPS